MKSVKFHVEPHSLLPIFRIYLLKHILGTISKDQQHNIPSYQQCR